MVDYTNIICLLRVCETNLSDDQPSKSWTFVKGVFCESYRMTGIRKPCRYPLTRQEWNRPGTVSRPGMNRGAKLCIIQKTCFSLGAHNVQKAGCIFQSICRFLQPILTVVICDSGSSMRMTVDHTDPGRDPNHVNIRFHTLFNCPVYH